MSNFVVGFSSDPLEPGKPDILFYPEFLAFKRAGIETVVLPDDNIKLNKKLSNLGGKLLLYRGWMKTIPDYIEFESLCLANNISLFTNAKQYKSAHHIDGWVDKIASCTAETKLFPLDCNLSSGLSELDWDSFFIKDYVKSSNASFGSIAHSLEEVDTVIREYRRYRDPEGGWAVRKTIAFVPGSERRIFVVCQVPHQVSGAIPSKILKALSDYRDSDFYSVDIGTDTDNQTHIIEIGDGQVSGLSGWSADDFAALFKDFNVADYED